MHSNWFGKTDAKAAARRKIMTASIIGCMVTLQLGAFSVVVETTLSGITELPFGAFCALMQPIHLAIGLVEGLITSAVLVFVLESRPELLQEANCEAKGISGKRSLKTTVVMIAVVAAVVGGGLSLFASSNPDGLEWALFGNAEAGFRENMALDETHFGVESPVADAVEPLGKCNLAQVLCRIKSPLRHLASTLLDLISIALEQGRIEHQHDSVFGVKDS